MKITLDAVKISQKIIIASFMLNKRLNKFGDFSIVGGAEISNILQIRQN